jgi:hypothetical protein
MKPTRKTALPGLTAAERLCHVVALAGFTGAFVKKLIRDAGPEGMHVERKTLQATYLRQEQDPLVTILRRVF